MKHLIKKLLRERLNSRGIVDFLRGKDFKNTNSETFLYHGTSIPPSNFNLRDDYEWEDSSDWSGDLPYDHLFLTTDINEALAYGQYIIPCELSDYDCASFRVYDDAPSQVFDKDYGIDLYKLDEPLDLWGKYEDSGKSCLAVKGNSSTTIISYISNIIPRVDLAIEFYTNQ